MYLPGQWFNGGDNQECEGTWGSPGCPDKAMATQRQITETDSFGDEFGYYCSRCAEKQRELDKQQGPEIGTCDGCSAQGVEIRPIRDPDEGNHGPVYDRCDACIKSLTAYHAGD